MDNLIAIGLVFLTRMIMPVFFWFRGRSLIATDAWSHVCSSVLMKRRNHRPFMRMPNTDNSGEDYPWLYFWLLSFFPEKMIMRVGMMTGAIFDTLVFVVILGAYYNLNVSYFIGSVNPVFIAALFLFTPHLTRITTGKLIPRPRPLGVFLGSIIMLMQVYYLVTDSRIAFIIAVLIYVPLALSSKFAVQAIVGLNIVFGLLTKNTLIILYPVLAIGLSVLLTYGETWKLLKGQIRHSIVYWCCGYHFVENFNKVYIPKNFSKDELWLVMKSLFENAYFHVLTGLPMLYFIVYHLMQGGLMINPLTRALLMWLGAGVVLFMSTSIWKFKVFGQAERYLDFCIVPYMLLGIAVVPLTNTKIILLICLYGMIMYFLHFIAHYKYLGADAKYIEKIIDGYKWLNCEEKICRVISISYPYSRFGLMYTKHIYPFTQGVPLSQRDKFNDIYSRYPYPPSDLKCLVRENKIDYVVKIKRAVKDKIFSSLEKKIFENEALEIYDVKEV